MSNDNKLYYDKWSSQLKAAHQTSDNVYAGLVDTMGMESNRFFWKITGQVDMASVNNEDSEHGHQERDYEERQMQASPAFLALKWEKGELLRAHADVKSDWIAASVKAMNRWNAAVIRAAATGSATAQYEGESSSSAKTLGADQILGDGTTNVTEAIVKGIRGRFVKNKALQAGQKIYYSVSQEEEDALTAIEHFINADYNNSSAIESGVNAGRLYGVNIIRDQDLTEASDTRTGFAWVKSGIMFGSQAGVLTRQDEIQTRHYMDQFYLRVDNGATRTRETDVMSILTDVA